MGDPSSFGKILILAGFVIVMIGVIIFFGGKYFPLGKLPGDIRIEKENFRFYFPIVTCILLSILFSLIFWIASKLK